MRTSILVVSLLLVLAPLSGAGGQDIGSLQQGARIRVAPAQGKSMTGVFSGVDTDSLRFLTSSPPAVKSLSLGDVRSLKVSKGRDRSSGALKGGFRGLAIGAVAGGVFGAVSYEEPESCFIFCSTRTLDAFFGAFFVGVSGAAIGSVYGAIKGRDRWEPVGLPSR